MIILISKCLNSFFMVTAINFNSILLCTDHFYSFKSSLVQLLCNTISNARAKKDLLIAFKVLSYHGIFFFLPTQGTSHENIIIILQCEIFFAKIARSRRLLNLTIVLHKFNSMTKESQILE